MRFMFLIENFSPISTSEGFKVRQGYGVVREMGEILLVFYLWTSVAREAEINCYNPIFLPRTTM